MEGDGTFGAVYAMMRVLSGFGTCMFCVHHKGSESNMRLITNAMFDPLYERFLGIEASPPRPCRPAATWTAAGI